MNVSLLATVNAPSVCLVLLLDCRQSCLEVSSVLHDYICVSVCLHDERPRCSVDMRYAMDSDKVVPIDGRDQTSNVTRAGSLGRNWQSLPASD
jgi:hypothetical protein